MLSPSPDQTVCKRVEENHMPTVLYLVMLYAFGVGVILAHGCIQLLAEAVVFLLLYL